MNTKIEAHTLIFSDIHLGSRVSLAEKIPKVLERYNYKNLILLGDIFENDKLKLNQKHWEFVGYIKGLVREAKQEFFWILGNHDRKLSRHGSEIFGVLPIEEHAWEYNGKKYLALHGDRFDDFIEKNKTLIYITDTLYAILQFIDRTRKFTKFVKRTAKQFISANKTVLDGAVDYAKQEKADVVICGHTHYAWMEVTDGIKYMNTGCWTESPATLLVVDENGERLEEVMF